MCFVSFWSSLERRRDPGDGTIGGGGGGEDWLHDYAVGSNFEVYSVPLEVLSENSSLWGLSFSRQASERVCFFRYVLCYVPVGEDLLLR